MMDESLQQNSKLTIRNLFPRVEDVNLGIILVGIYFIFEFGAVQGLFPIVSVLRMPLLISAASYLYAMYLIVSGKIDFSSKTTWRFLVLCLFIALYAFFGAKNPEEKTNLPKAFWLFFSNYIIIIHSVKKPSQYMLLLDIWLVAIAFSSYNGIMQGGKIWGSRWLKDENHISLVAATAIPFAFLFFRVEKSKLKKLFYVGLLGSYVAVNVVAHSRGGTLSMVIVALLCWFFTKNRFRNFVVMLIGVLLVFKFAPPEFFQEMDTLKQGTKEGTADDRIYLWGFCFDMFADHPILGVGPLNYPYEFPKYEKGVRYPYGYKRPPHTTPLQWLAEFGLVGVILLLLLFDAMYKNWKRHRWYKDELEDKDEEKNLLIFPFVTHAAAISQVGFWFGAIFLSLLPYPFYWPLVPFSEAWKNIYDDLVEEIEESQHGES